MREIQRALDPLLPPEVAARAEEVGERKARIPLLPLLGLGGLAGAFIAIGAQLVTVVTTGAELGFGVNRLVGGVAFSVGLVLVVIAGAELFTGNNLIIMAWASRRVSTLLLLRNWVVVYAANLVGSLATVGLIYWSRQWALDNDGVGATALRVADAKTELSFGAAFARGVLANALVCLAVWLAYSGRSNTDKVLGVVFPITAFVASGFEHSIANMYFIPMGILVKGDASVVAASGLSPADLSDLNVGSFIVDNLLPVTLGNIVGGALLVGLVYWIIYLWPRRGQAAAVAPAPVESDPDEE